MARKSKRTAVAKRKTKTAATTRKPSKTTKPKTKPRARAVAKSNPARRKSVKPTGARAKAVKKAAATRKRNRAAELESLRLSELAPSRKKAAKVRQRRRKARDRQGQLEAKAIAAGPRATASYETLVAALERMARGSGMDLEVRGAPDEGKTPWLVQGAFIPRGVFTYEDLQAVLAGWEGDYTLEATINPRRVAWIRWDVLRLAQMRGRDGAGYAPGGIGEWGRVISEAQQAADSLSETYQADERGNGTIMEVQVYFGATVVGGRTIRL